MLLDRVMKTMETVSLPGNMLPLKLTHSSNGSHDTNGRVKVENGTQMFVDEDDDDGGAPSCRC